MNRHGRVSAILNKSTLYVYILHTVVLGGLASVMLPTAPPSLLKLATLTVATYTACHLLVHYCGRLIDATTSPARMEVRAVRTLTPALLLVTILSVTGCGKQERPREKAIPPHVGIHLAALQGHVDAIRQHIKAGSNLDEKDEHGSTPLIVAVTFGKTEVARALIEAMGCERREDR